MEGWIDYLSDSVHRHVSQPCADTQFQKQGRCYFVSCCHRHLAPMHTAFQGCLLQSRTIPASCRVVADFNLTLWNGKV